jgi:DNA gyrase subunit A
MELVKDISEELKTAYLDYAMSVIVGRALPDVRDGLKPVQRRILYSMYEMGLTHNKPHVKCARVVGHVLGHYHPHGDAPVYEALVRMAQDFVMRYPLIDGQGNFGSIDGDEPAAMRYTECRLTKIAEEMLEDIDKNTVDFQPNFDASRQEPVVLPSKIPNLLINGCTGIAVGMATNIPPHNLTEICNGIIAYIKNPDISIEELMKYIKGPDFPTGGVIVGRKGIIEAYKTGKGRITIRGKVEIEKDKIIIREIPYMVNKAKLVEKIAELVKNDKLLARTVRDESDREGIRIVVEVREDVYSALKKLYAHTPLQTTFSIINLALVDNEPRILNLKELIAHYVDHRREVIRRKVEFELGKAEERLHIVEGLKIALENIDRVISIIRGSKSPEYAKSELINSFGLSEKQAEAILQLRLQKLTSMEYDSLMKEYEDLKSKIAEYREILGDKRKIDEIIIKELEDIKEKYGDKRRTEIVEKDDIVEVKEVEESVLVISEDGYAKRVEFGRTLKCKPKVVISARSDQKLLIFTDTKAYWIPVDSIPKSDKGVHLSKFIALDGEVVSAIALDEFEGYVVIVTAEGNIKKVKLSEFVNAKRAGIIASSERIAFARLYKDGEVLIATKNGYVVRFKSDEIPEYGRTAKGVRAINLREGDKISWLSIGKGKEVLILTEDGFAKRVPIDEIRLTNRGAMGVIGVRGCLAVAEIVEKDKYIALTKDGGIVNITVNRLPVLDRYKKGKNVAKDIATILI